MLDPKDLQNWDFLVAAVQNPQGAYVNARAERYARAIIAADMVIKSIDVQTAPQPKALS